MVVLFFTTSKGAAAAGGGAGVTPGVAVGGSRLRWVVEVGGGGHHLAVGGEEGVVLFSGDTQRLLILDLNLTADPDSVEADRRGFERRRLLWRLFLKVLGT